MTNLKKIIFTVIYFLGELNLINKKRGVILKIRFLHASNSAMNLEITVRAVQFVSALVGRSLKVFLFDIGTFNPISHGW